MSIDTEVTIEAPERPDEASAPRIKPGPHRDFVEKVAGTLRYADDWGFPGMLHGVVVRAQLPSARIVSIDTSAAEAVQGVRAVMTAADIPHNGILDEASGLGVDAIVQPVLADDRVRYDGEPVAIIAAETPGAALEAAGLVEVEYEDLPGVFDPEEALRDDAPAVHAGGNRYVTWRSAIGDVDEAMQSADLVLEETYRSQRVDHAYLEPEAGIGWIDSDGVLTLRVSTQVIEHAREIAEILKWPHSRVRVIAAYMGGGFGGKEDFTVEPFIALLVWKTRRPVRMVWTRQESLLARQKRHPFIMRYRTGVRDDGTIVAQDIRIIGDAGAYPLLSSRVLFAAAVNSTGPYRVDNARVESTAVFTNTVPTSAMRGFGAMQVVFAYESQMDLIAERLGVEPAEVRERNFVRRGDPRVTGETIDTGVGVCECMRRALSELGPITPADPERPNTRIGRGFGCSMQPYGRSVFFADRASAWIGLEKDGTMVIRAGVTDLGAGQSASLANIAGEVLGITVDRTSVHIGDSALTPLTGGTFATRQLYMSGNAVLKVARALRAKLEPVAAALLECEVTDLTFEQNLVSAGGRSISMGELSRAAEHQSVMPYHHDTFEAETGKFDAETGKGRSFPDCTHGAHAVEVEVDTDTGEVRVLKYVAVHDIGRAINMQRVEGQIQGAVAQGVGYALSEEVEVTGGVVSSTLFADYLIPTAVDLPDIKAIGLELHPGKGPFGARGIGEPPIGPPPAALASAIHDAVGVRLHRLPMTPEHILGALREARVDSPTTASCMTAAKVVPGGAAVALLKPRSEPPSIPAMSVSPRAFHGSMVGYQPTPLRDAPHAARRLGVAEVLVKDESERLGLPSFKVLGASWAVHRALVEHLGSTLEEIPTFDLLAAALARARPLTLAAATDGNHGRAVAHVAALLGLDARIYVPGDMVPARIAAIESEGAAVTVVEGGYDDAVARSAQDAGERCLVISDTSWPGYERVPAWVIEGYSTIFAEIDEALVSAQREQPDAVVVPIGVGALAAAAVRHYWSLQNGRPRLMGVEPTSAACVLESVATGRIVTLEHPQTSIMAGLNCETPSLIAWPLVSRGIDVYLAVPDSYVGDATRLLAADGIVAGECGAAGLAAVTALASDGHLSEAREALGLGPDSRILLLSTEGATDPKAYRRLVGGAS